jgi:hypothetical protein
VSNKDLIRQYVNIGAILPEYQVGKLSKNNVKSYLNRRLQHIENEVGKPLLDYEILNLDEANQKKYIKGLSLYDIHKISIESNQESKIIKLISDIKKIDYGVLNFILDAYIYPSIMDDIPQEKVNNLILKMPIEYILKVSLNLDTDKLIKTLYDNTKELKTPNDLIRLVTKQEKLYDIVERDYNHNYSNMLNIVEKYYDNNWVNKMNDISNSIKFDLIDAYNKSGFTYYDSEDENGRKVKIRENNLLKKLGWNDYHTEHAELLDDNQIKKVILMNNKGSVKYV